MFDRKATGWVKSSHFATILGYAFKLPARSLTVAALLVLRRRPAAYGIRLRLCRAVSLW
ncbi:MAG: hypothetical protein ACR2L2_18465 [Acidobacteriota bacterium]